MIRSQALGVTQRVRAQGQAVDQCAQQHAHTHSVVQRTTGQWAHTRSKQLPSFPSAQLFVPHENKRMLENSLHRVKPCHSYLKKKNSPQKTPKNKQGDLETLICTGLVC